MGTTKPQRVLASIAVGICGKTASGKSSLARALARTCNSQVISFGAYVRGAALARGLRMNRYALQELGDQLIGQIGADLFLMNVVQENISNLAIPDLCLFDGGRHEQIWTAITERFSCSILIGVKCNETERAR